MDKDKIITSVRELGSKEPWNHQIELPHGVLTRSHTIDSPGFNTTKWKRMLPLFDKVPLSGKTVLDVGCSDGYFCVQAAKMGAIRVVGTEVDPLRLDRARFVMDVLGLSDIDQDVVEISESNILDLNALGGVRFDVVFGLGLLHRVTDLDGCINSLASLGDTLVLEFKTLNRPSSEKQWHGGKSKSNKYNPLCYTPTLTYVENMLERLGFRTLEVIADDDSHLNFRRTILMSQREAI